MLIPSPLCPLAIRLIRCDRDSVILDAHGTVRRGRCPTCGTTSIRVHARYPRHPNDLPWRTCSVQFTLTVRRFCCDNQMCPRRTFAEGFGSTLQPRARRTVDANTLLLDLAESAGGEVGARLAGVAGLPVSPGTRLRVALLRLLHRAVLPIAATPRVLGVDDLETHRPFDLLKGRTAETLASWLRTYPGGLTSPTLQPYVSYLQDRWQAGCHSVAQLHREIVLRGYQGSYSLLQQALAARRPPRPSRTERKRTRQLSIRWLCLRPPEELEPDERPVLEQVLPGDEGLKTGYQLLQRFRNLIAERDVPALVTWLLDAETSGLPSFVTLVHGMRADYAAVEAALTTERSNGPVEGHVHRVKLIKRQGYGRAGFDLLRRRVLVA